MFELTPTIDRTETTPEQHSRRVMHNIFTRRLSKVIEAIEEAIYWNDGDEHALMMLLMDAKTLHANAAA